MTTPTFALRVAQHRQRVEDILARTQHRDRLVDILARTYKRDKDGKFSSGGGGVGGHGPVRDELAQAQTIGELNDALASAAQRITGRRIRVDMTGSDLQVGREHAEGILRSLERFPDAPLVGVRVVGPAVGHQPGDPMTPQQQDDHWNYMAMSGAVAVTVPNGNGTFWMPINRDYAGDPQRYDAAMKEAHRTGEYVAPSPIGVATHEMGHVVARAGQAAGAAQKAAEAEAKRRGLTVSTLIERDVSRYATSNPEELTGEAFADVMLHGSDASPLSQVVFREIVARAPGRGDVHAHTTTVPVGRTYKRDERGRFGSGSGGIRQSLQDAKTTEEVAHVLKAEVSTILGRDVRVGLAGLDVDVARVHAEGILRGAEAYPEARLHAVGTYGPDSPFGHYAGLRQDAYAITARGEDIWLNTDHGHIDDFAGEMAHSDAASHLAGVHGDLTRVALHEFGHVVDGTTNGRMGKAALRIAKELAGPNVDRKAFTRVSVSRYAATNGSELAAEAFMDVVSRGGRGGSLLSQRIFSDARGLAGDLHDRFTPTFLLRLAHARDRLEIAARTYKRDKDGKFSSGGGGVRESLAAATTIDELNRAAQAEMRAITGRDIPVDLAGADLGIAKEHVEGIAQGLERFPGATLVGVYTYGPRSAQSNMGGEIARLHPDASAVTQSFGLMDGGKFVIRSVVYLNTRDQGDPATYRAERLQAHADGYLATSTPTGTALHEFGHVIAGQTGVKRSAYDTAVELADAAGTTPRHLISRQVSSYASSDMGEFAAEAFADVMTRGDSASDVSKAAFKVMDDAYQQG